MSRAVHLQTSEAPGGWKNIWKHQCELSASRMGAKGSASLNRHTMVWSPGHDILRPRTQSLDLVRTRRVYPAPETEAVLIIYKQMGVGAEPDPEEDLIRWAG